MVYDRMQLGLIVASVVQRDGVDEGDWSADAIGGDSATPPD